mgnify:CR=1 FL=1
MLKPQSFCHDQSSCGEGQPDQAPQSFSSPRLFAPLDEDQIGEPFYRFQQLKRIDPRSAFEAFSQFKTAMIRRMDSEDVELFPAFEARVGKEVCNISDTLRQEHEEIRRVLNEIEVKLSRSDFSTQMEERALEAALIAHNHRETNVVYSALE